MMSVQEGRKDWKERWGLGSIIALGGHTAVRKHSREEAKWWVGPVIKDYMRSWRVSKFGEV